MRFLKSCFSVFLLINAFVAYAADREVLIPWGAETSQLGVYRDVDYQRGALFFDTASDGSLWIADAYKARVVHYSSQGQFLDQVPLDAVSPRMTAFRRFDDGTFAVFNDQTLSRWTGRGELVGRVSLGLGVPEGCWLTVNRASVVLSDEQGKYTQEYDKTFQKVARLLLPSPRGSAALVKDEADQWGLFFWKDQSQVFGWKAAVDPEASLVGGIFREATVWSRVEQGTRTFWWVDGTGKLRGKASAATAGAPGLFSIASGPQVVAGKWTDKGLSVRWIPWQTAPSP